MSSEPPDAETESLDPAPVKEATPKDIGPYKVLQVLGEGGMGVVYLAEQTEPIKRRVALKLIKLGMDTKHVITRFESERQALALMNHANIARVFDAGATEQGRPYFVMEYVEGLPITECCDKLRLTTDQRLRLFIQVCEGIQHAHQKGIIHRDIKPSNVLTKTEGDRHIPKIIDFGVAKATGQHLTDATMYTQLGQPVGTLEYMSPEQAEMSGLGIDTRTDVYSLGVLLYELLIGAKPFSVKESHLAGLDDWRRKIRDEDAPKASTRLGTLGDASSAAVKNRRTDVSGLLRELRGDLDWVLMKALEKDRTRRYASASELAADIERHLDNQPVLACPPSTMYRFRKFTRRHRAGVAAAALIVLALGIGVAGTSIALVQAVRAEARATDEAARANREAATSNQVLQFLVGLFAVVDPSEARGKEITAREILDRGAARIEKELADQPDVQATLMDTMGVVYRSLGLYDSATPLLEQALETRRRIYGHEHPQVAVSMNNLAKVLDLKAVYDTAETLYRNTLTLRRKLFGEEHEQVAESLHNLAFLLAEKGDYAAAEPLYREALSMRRKLLGNEHQQVARSLNDLALNQFDQGDLDAAETLLREALAMRRKLLGNEHPDVTDSLNDLGLVLYKKGEYEAAEPLFRESLELKRKLHGDVHPEVATTLNNLAFLLHDKADYEQAEVIYGRVLTVQRELLGNEHPNVAMALNNLAFVLHAKGDLDGAEKLSRESLAMYRQTLGERHPEVARVLNNLGRWLQDKGDYAGAEAMLREALDIRRVALGNEHWEVASNLGNLADLLAVTGRYEEARPLAVEAQGILAKAFSKDHWRTAVAQSVLGACLSGLKEFGEAESLLLDSYATIKAKKGEDTTYTRDASRRIVELYHAWGKPQKAKEYQRSPATAP